MNTTPAHKQSPETREKLRQSAIKQWADLEAREKARQAGIRHMAVPGARENLRRANLGKKLSPKTRQKIRQAILGRKHTPEAREKVRQARLRQRLPRRMTSIERLLYQEFKKRRLKFEMHKTMFNRWQPDFVFEQARLIVEADGDYWHSRPDSRARDSVFNATAAADGWSVWRFGGKQIEMHPASCGRAVARFVRDH